MRTRTYETFKNFLLEVLPEYIDEEFGIDETFKGNSKVEKLVVKNETVSPAFMLQKLYEEFLETPVAELDDFLAKIAEEVRYNLEQTRKYDAESIKGLLDWDSAKGKIMCCLMNHAENEEFLETVPHRDFLDLAIVYRCVEDIGESAAHSMVITNGLMVYMGVDENTLYETAMDNDFSVECRSIAEMLGFPEPEVPMWSMTNKNKYMGANVMLRKDVLKEIAERFGSDIYILPSSIHDLIAVPAVKANVRDLQMMVDDINRKEVDYDERLSNNVYKYSRNTDEVTQETFCYHGLDGRPLLKAI